MILNNKNNNINEIIKGFGFSINTFIDKAKELKVLNIIIMIILNIFNKYPYKIIGSSSETS